MFMYVMICFVCFYVSEGLKYPKLEDLTDASHKADL